MASFFEYLFYFVFFYFAITVFYLFSLSVGARIFSRRLAAINPSGAGGGKKRIAILVPAYKEDGIIVSTAASHLGLDYPRERFDVYILADSFREDTLAELRRMPVEVLVMKFDKSTKIKSLNSALERMQKDYDIVVISDADN